MLVDVITTTKKCTKCGEIRKVEEFFKINKNSVKRRSHCKACHRQYNLDHADRIKKYCREYNLEHADELKKKKQQYNLEHANKIKQNNQRYYLEHADEKKANQREYNKKHVGEIKKYNRQYSLKNAEKLKEKKRKYRRQRYKNNPQYKITDLLRSRFKRELKERVNGQNSYKEIKKTSALNLLGCDIPFFISYIKERFYPHPDTGEEMTWENHGHKTWHLDHIRPLSSFDLTDQEQQKKAFHYTNYQPLWAFQNLQKR